MGKIQKFQQKWNNFIGKWEQSQNTYKKIKNSIKNYKTQNFQDNIAFLENEKNIIKTFKNFKKN